jgi:hypothetical protein
MGVMHQRSIFATAMLADVAVQYGKKRIEVCCPLGENQDRAAALLRSILETPVALNLGRHGHINQPGGNWNANRIA